MVSPPGPSGTHLKYAMHDQNQPEPILMNRSTSPTISMQHPWHHRETDALPTKNQASMERGPHMVNPDGTLGLHPNIIDVTKSIFLKHKAHEFVIQWSSFQPTAKCLKCLQMMQPSTQQMTLSRHLPSHNHPMHSYQLAMTTMWPYDN